MLHLSVRTNAVKRLDCAVLMRNVRLQIVDAIAKRQQRMTPINDDHRFVPFAQDR